MRSSVCSQHCSVIGKAALGDVRVAEKENDIVATDDVTFRNKRKSARHRTFDNDDAGPVNTIPGNDDIRYPEKGNDIVFGQNVKIRSKRKSARHRCLNNNDAGPSCTYSDVSPMDFGKTPLEAHVLPMTMVCLCCGARKFHKESKGFCCADGKIRLKSHDPPDKLQRLFTTISKDSTDFLKYVRSYNCNFSMTSFGVHYDKDLFEDYHGIYTFRIQGQVYHFINEIVPRAGELSYLQLYLYDTDNEVHNRIQVGNRLHGETLANLIHILDINPYVKFFRSLGASADLKTQSIVIHGDPKVDQRQYNVPTVSQVAALCVEHDDSSEICPCDIVVQCFDGTSKKIQHYFGCYDPLQYPLLFPHGESGWHRGIQLIDKNKGDNLLCDNEDVLHADNFFGSENIIDAEIIASTKKRRRANVSCRDYYCYKLQIRPLENSILLHSGRLLQQYVVDMYVKIETSRLDYFRQNQTALRAELYQGIVDSVDIGERRKKNWS